MPAAASAQTAALAAPAAAMARRTGRAMRRGKRASLLHHPCDEALARQGSQSRNLLQVGIAKETAFQQQPARALGEGPLHVAFVKVGQPGFALQLVGQRTASMRG